MKEREQWIDDVFMSLDGLKKVQPKEELYDSIILNLANVKKVFLIPMKHLKWVGVAASILIALNILSYSLNTKVGNDPKTTRSNDINLISDYSLYK